MLRILLSIAIGLGAQKSAYDSQYDDVRLPEPARRFVVEHTRPIVFELADLNRDGRQDAILVLESTEPVEPWDSGHQRVLVVLVGELDGTFREAARNARIALASGAGGMMGDPFWGVTVGRGTFTVSNGGGSGVRWVDRFTFAYSRRNDTWQLVKVHEIYGRPTEARPHVFVPPTHFGKIGIAEFDPEHWKGVGPK